MSRPVLRNVATLLAATGVILGAAQAAVTELDVPFWITLALLGSSAVIGVGTLLTAHKERESRLENQLAHHFQYWPLPLISDVDMYALGVFRSAIADRYVAGRRYPPYIRRDQDNQLEELIGTTDLVVLVGPSKAGKSRTAFEFVARLASEHANLRLLVPADATSLVSLTNHPDLLDRVEGPVVVWLDDLERFVSANALSLGSLEYIRRRTAPVFFVATLRAKEHERLTSAAASESARTARLLLDNASVVRLHRDSSEEERLQANELYGDETFRSGIGDHFSQSSLLAARFLNGVETCPLGASIVRAAVDWRRAGHIRPCSRSFLLQAAPEYLRASPNSHDIKEKEQEALKWGLEPIESGASLLLLNSKTNPRQYEVFDYIVDLVDSDSTHKGSTGPTIPEAVWSIIIEYTTKVELTSLALTAITRNDGSGAEAAWQGLLEDSLNSVPPRDRTGQDESEVVAFRRRPLDPNEEPIVWTAVDKLGALLASKPQDRQQMLEAIWKTTPTACILVLHMFKLLLLRDDPEAQAAHCQSLRERGDPRLAQKAMWILGLTERAGSTLEGNVENLNP